MEFAPLQLAPALVVGVMYWLRARTITVPAWRVWCFYGGLVLMAATLSSPLAASGDRSAGRVNAVTSAPTATARSSRRRR